MRENCLLIIAGPSAVGKTTVAYALMERDPRYEFVRSVTTRPSRGDAYDAEYIYITVDEFRELIANGGVLEHTEYAGNFYGTPRSEIDRITDEGRVPLLILDLNGANSLFNAEGISPCTVYLYDDLDIMEERLKARYISENTSEADQKRYDTRSKQNLIDYSNMENYESFIYSFIKNCATVECCANKVSEIYDIFAFDTSKNIEETKATAKALASSAKAKM
jgi:guanylate kinase